ncbi:MAG: M23 family metallopeptidase [Woeseiaceae bacterium]|nr:M23 family metallopeptidase [Woeseiaceae bacterium]
MLPTLAHAGCKDDWICIDEIRNDSDVELRARNLQEFPITYTLRVDARNYSISGPNTVTRTLGPGESQQVMLLDGNGGDKGYFRYDLKWTVGRKDAIHDDDHLYALPYAGGNAYRVLQGYGSRFSHRGHEEFAVDFDMQTGTDVHAARAGVIARIEESNSKGCWDDDCGQYANYVVILHSDGTTGEYYHLDHDGVLVEVGDRVERGQKIARSGNTGHTTMPHLHFAVYRPISWGRTQSIAVRFLSADGIIERPRRGARYPAQQGDQS